MNDADDFAAATSARANFERAQQRGGRRRSVDKGGGQKGLIGIRIKQKGPHLHYRGLDGSRSDQKHHYLQGAGGHGPDRYDHAQ